MSKPAWGQVPKPAEVNLKDIISTEEQIKQDERLAKNLSLDSTDTSITDINTEDITPFTDDACADDLSIALILQEQYNREYNESVKNLEKSINKNCKVTINYDKFLRGVEFGDEDRNFAEVDEEDCKDNFDSVNKELESIRLNGGYKTGQNGEIITKHDKALTGRKNVMKMVVNFGPGFHTGDPGGLDDGIVLSNKIYNKLKTYSKYEENRRTRTKDKKDHSTKSYLTENDKIWINKLENQGLIGPTEGVISIGKEAAVLSASALENGDDGVSSEFFALKVYQMQPTQFKQRDQYIRDDYRFKDRVDKHHGVELIHLWAEREKLNLERLQRAEINCPKPLVQKNNILVMSLIGSDGTAAPKLKHARLSDAQYEVAYSEVCDIMRKMYSEAHLVHADFSEYNLLYHNDECYVIDVGQAVLVDHKDAEFYLKRDCENITSFFGRKRVKVSPAEDLYESIISASNKLRGDESFTKPSTNFVELINQV